MSLRPKVSWGMRLASPGPTVYWGAVMANVQIVEMMNDLQARLTSLRGSL
jgi:hypothetical protein